MSIFYCKITRLTISVGNLVFLNDVTEICELLVSSKTTPLSIYMVADTLLPLQTNHRLRCCSIPSL